MAVILPLHQASRYLFPFFKFYFESASIGFLVIKLGGIHTPCPIYFLEFISASQCVSLLFSSSSIPPNISVSLSLLREPL